MVEKKEDKISEDEAALYDRQIRLWGLDAQNRLRNASILLVGVSGLGAELAKNLMLAGLKSLTLMDHQNVSETDCRSQFLAPTDAVGKNRAEASLERCRQLNPMVKVIVETCEIISKPFEYLAEFDLVCLVDQPKSIMERINEACRLKNVKFCSGGIYGWVGYCFLDLIEHEYVDEEIQSQEQVLTEEAEIIGDEDDEAPPPKKPKIGSQGAGDEPVLTKKKDYYVPFGEAVNANWRLKTRLGRAKKLPPAYFIIKTMWKYLGTREGTSDSDSCASSENAESLSGKLEPLWKETQEELGLKPEDLKLVLEDFVGFVNGAFNPVCAIVGGVLGQEIIKAVSQKDKPINNMFFYNGLDSTGIVAEIPPPVLNRT